jgi:hypothetical protein
MFFFTLFCFLAPLVSGWAGSEAGFGRKIQPQVKWLVCFAD